MLVRGTPEISFSKFLILTSLQKSRLKREICDFQIFKVVKTQFKDFLGHTKLNDSIDKASVEGTSGMFFTIFPPCDSQEVRKTQFTYFQFHFLIFLLEVINKLFPVLQPPFSQHGIERKF